MSDEYKAICEKGLNELYSLRAENEELQGRVARLQRTASSLDNQVRAAEGTTREVAAILRAKHFSSKYDRAWADGLADRLDPPPVVEK